MSETTKKIDPNQLRGATMSAFLAVEAMVREGGLPITLVHLIKLLASYRNGCAYCVDMHTRNARASGETEQRLYATPIWRQVPFFSARERAALAFAEALTRLDEGGVPGAVFAEARRQFSEAEIASLAVVVIAINMWNRLTAVVHYEPGSYQGPAATPAAPTSAVTAS
jgi:AhpD family alkylhydroperoxidase